ncbi:nucleoside triphosphate pyrophosphohydrolase [Thioclava sp. GXIMD4215]|uniref:nucleoside triphosphate pyrophosphohydrolase n=1 Tax=Thioclava sp. GXIMD4215 TaxID=3131928 RepID=UPI0032440BC0
MTSPDDPIIFDDQPEAGHQFQRLLAIMSNLRNPDTGCPWDIEQDFGTIAPYTLEEAHEVADAIERAAWDELPAELGDLALQVVFHAQIAKDRGLFDVTDVLRAINNKMVHRHPHVFGTENRDKTAQQQSADWEKIKAAERATKGKRETPTGVLDDVALALPALTRALKLQKRAARVGFDWTDIGDVLAKISEESEELVEARAMLGADEIAEEYGDLLFVMVNLGRHLDLDPEACLRATNSKFTRRFAYIEDALRKRGKTPDQSDLEEMDALWNAAKAAGIK